MCISLSLPLHWPLLLLIWLWYEVKLVHDSLQLRLWYCASRLRHRDLS